MKDLLTTLAIAMFAVYCDNFTLLIKIIGLATMTILLIGGIKKLRERK